MADQSSENQRNQILGLFRRAPGGRIAKADLVKKASRATKGRSLASTAELAHALDVLIDGGLVRVTGGGSEGLHPRAKASYLITDEGRARIRPARPTEVSQEVLEAQVPYLLLLLARARDRKLTRSELNAKLKTKAAVGFLEFNVADHPETIDYHLTNLVELGAIAEKHVGASTSYRFNPEVGLAALAAKPQYDNAELNLTIPALLLNALLAAARGSGPARDSSDADVGLSNDEPMDRDTDLAGEPRIFIDEHPMSRDDIHGYIAELRRGPYAGEDLIPIHDLRRVVGEHLGADAASHARLDPLLMEMRADRALKLIAISDGRQATDDQIRDSIPGVNETIFYLDVE